jgi:hypothetical protein
MNRDRGHSPLDSRIDQLSGTLREQGMTPPRDLWPDIDRAIAAADQTPRRVRPAWVQPWRLTSLAASLALMLGLGYLGVTGGGAPQGQARHDAGLSRTYAAADQAAPGGVSSLQRLDNTLEKLNEALDRDPANTNLSRLVLLVHKSRASVLRHSAGETVF